jgi:hypothetical protein
MNTKEFTQSHSFKYSLVIVGVLVIFFAAFSLGEHVGFRKAAFSFQNGNNFYRTFGPDSGHDMTQSMEFSDAHGTVGKVISITLPTITVEDRDNTEKTIVVSDQTVIHQLRNTLTENDLKVGDYIVAIGEPNPQSQIAASLIRILPPPPVTPSQ